jgi:hypothetical protein
MRIPFAPGVKVWPILTPTQPGSKILLPDKQVKQVTLRNAFRIRGASLCVLSCYLFSLLNRAANGNKTMPEPGCAKSEICWQPTQFLFRLAYDEAVPVRPGRGSTCRH